MSFTLTSGEAVITWDEGKVAGAPLLAVERARQALVEHSAGVGSTPTGPWFASGTPEHAYLVLRPLWPYAEETGTVPKFKRLEFRKDVVY